MAESSEKCMAVVCWVAHEKSEVTPVISEHRKEDYSILFSFLYFFSAAAAGFGRRRETSETL